MKIQRLLLLFAFSCAFFRGICFSNDERAPAVGDSKKSVLILYDGPEDAKNPGRLDAVYLGNLLGHFTTHRTLLPLEQYAAGRWKEFDAVFCIIYQKNYAVPPVFLDDAKKIKGPFCWLGNQVGQLAKGGFLKNHGIEFIRFFENSPADRVLYNGRTVGKGDPDTNILKVTDEAKARVVADALGKDGWSSPYILRSGSFWTVADSPFSYSNENDRYLVFADALHDILGEPHEERHLAMLRIEDINPLSEPKDLKAMLRVIESNKIPFAFGFVPFYVNPTQRIFEQMSDKPEVADVLQKYARSGGQAVLHGDTHQYRGVTTDDYEFWDDIADRPVKRDSETFAARRVEEALKESVASGLYPVTWETPHYAASETDYRVFKWIFKTTYERRQSGGQLGSDQFFPYPVIDLYGQYVIPESVGYVPKENPTSKEILANADAALTVRDGYASFFFHPFLKPQLLDELISGIKKRGFRFVGLPRFPNRVQEQGYLATNAEGAYEVGGEGRFLTEIVMSESGRVKSRVTREIPIHQKIKIKVSMEPMDTFVAYRHMVKPSTFIEKVVRLAKGDLTVVNRKFEGMLSSNVSDTMSVRLLWDKDAKGEEAIDQRSFEATLLAIGYDLAKIEAHEITRQELGKFSLLVIPAAAARRLTSDDIDRIYKAVEDGIVVVTDAETPLSRSFGFEIGGKTRVSNLENHLFPSQELRWPDQPLSPWIGHISEDQDTVFFSEREDKKPLCVGRKVGEGHVLYFAPYFDEISGQGYSRFPDLPYLLLSEFHIHPLLRKYGAEAYFDPGYRQNISVEQLATYWRKYGIRVIHVAAWHFYDTYSYDYERLIKVAHQNGILVYAWLEWPHVSQRFWDQHPAWREKNALLADARGGWRYLMNFQDPACFKAVLEDAGKLLTKLSWDGVNVAEFHFEGGAPSSPNLFTPLNSNARRSFEKLHGFDPVEIWKEGSPHSWRTNPDDLGLFYGYRKNVNTAFLSEVLRKIRAIPVFDERKMELVVTVFDVFGHPELSDRLGIDGPRTLALLNQAKATLQVEDPAEEWARPPHRYVELGERYRKMNLTNPFMIDINVLAVHPPSQIGFASDVPAGTEILQLFQAASSKSSRVCLYSESTIAETDWEILPYTMAANATVERRGDEWVVQAPSTVMLELNHPVKLVSLDDQIWFCHDKNVVLIPPGEHRVTLHPPRRRWFDTSQLDTRLISMSGELIGSEQKRYGLEVEYRSTGRCALMFSKQPYGTYIDDEARNLETVKGTDGYVVIAPPGQHRLRVISESALLHFMEYTSVVSASLIVLFGTASSGLLILLFIFIKIHRRLTPVRRKITRRMFPKKRTAS